jgi:AcrR family transcriptional regulator
MNPLPQPRRPLPSGSQPRLPAMARELPLSGAPSERADARRNRERIVAATRELVAERGLAEVRMEEVAARAGVAKGTIFHRFKNRAGLAVALVDERERELQDAVLSAPPPLGPGAPPLERLVAFLEALVDLTHECLDLLLVSDYDSPGQRYATGAYGAWRLHVSVLLEEAGHGQAAAGLAHALLAPLAADLVGHRVRVEGARVAELKRELGLLARASVGAGG